MYNRYIYKRKYKWVVLVQIVEIALFISMMFVSFHVANRLVYPDSQPLGEYRDMLHFLLSASIGIIILSMKNYFNFFDTSFLRSVSKAAGTVLYINVIVVVFLYFMDKSMITPYYFLILGGLETMSLISIKVLTNKIKENFFRRQTSLIIGSQQDRNILVESLEKQSLNQVIFVPENDPNLYKYLRKADYVYLLIVSRKELKDEIIAYCELHDLKIFMVPESHEIAMRDAEMTQIGDVPLFAIEKYQLTEAQAIVKRVIDIMLATIGILLTTPIMAVVSILIKKEDGGPVFYLQERCGLDTNPFNMIKFRSMIVDAEKHTGVVLAQKDDPRITKIGKILRATRIDEIPQFINVLLGNMSIVGPRPERPELVEKYLEEFPDYIHRFVVKPGITGLAQVMSNYTTTTENKLKFDLVYIKKYSPAFDLGILLKTVGVVFSKDQSQGFKDPDSDEGESQTKRSEETKNPVKKDRNFKPYNLSKVVLILLSSAIIIISSTFLRYTTLAVAAVEAMSIDVSSYDDQIGIAIADDEIPLASVDESNLLSRDDIERKLRSLDSGSKIKSASMVLMALSWEELVIIEKLQENGLAKEEILLIQDIMRKNFTVEELKELREITLVKK